MSIETGAPIELGVLYGPQAGSRLPLSPGEYLLGTGDECAIILAGMRMAARHALLSIDAEGVKIRPQEGSVSDALGNTIADTLALTLGMPVELGGISIAVDRVDAPWPDQDAVAPMPMPRPAAVAADAPPVQDTQATPPATQPRGFPWRPSRTAALAGGAVLVTLALVVAAASLDGNGQAAPAGASAAGPQQEQPPAEVPEEPPAALMQVLRVLDVTRSVTATYQPNGRWRVAGHVPSVEKREALARGLEALDPRPETEVYADEALGKAALEAINDRPEMAGSTFRIESVSNGVLRIGGAARDASAVERAKQAVLDSVPGVRQVDMHVLLRAQLLAQLKQRIEAAGLGRQVAVAREWPEVLVTGRLGDAERTRWNDLLAAFTAEYGQVLPVQASLSQDSSTPLEVSIIVGGAAPYVVTNKGVRVNRGGELDGHRLTVVSDSEVVFEGAERLRISR